MTGNKYLQARRYARYSRQNRLVSVLQDLVSSGEAVQKLGAPVVP